MVTSSPEVEAALMEIAQKRPWRMDDARKLVDAQAASGLSIVEFVKQLGVGEQRFHSWKSRLGGSIKKKSASISFAPVRVKSSSMLTSEVFAMEVVLENERRLRLRGNFDDAAVRRLVAILERRAP